MKNDYIVRKTYLSFVLVSIMTSLTATVGMLIDNVIVGHYLGSDALGAMGIVGPISLIFSALGNICSSGGGTRAAQALGRGEREKVNQIFSSNMLFVLIVGLFITVFGLIFTPQIASVLGASESLAEPSQQYLYGYFLGTIPTILVSAMMSFIRMDGSPKLPLICIAVMSIANIVLDLLMVVVFKQGMFGMAMATTISYCLAVLTACTHFLKKHCTLKMKWALRCFKEFPSTFITGMPTVISRVSDTLKSMVLNNLMVVFVSVGAVTALNVRTQANSILGAISIGIAQAISPTMGMFFGEEDKTAIRDTLKTTLKFGLTINGVIAFVFLIIPSMFAKLLGVAEPDILAMSSVAIRFFAVGMPITLINTVLMNVYQSTKRVRVATMICVLQSFVYTVIFAFILIRPLGSNGVWIAYLLGEILTLLTVAIFICIKNKRISMSLSAILMLDDKFGGDPKDRLELSIGNSMDEVMTISTGIYKFAKNREINEKMVNMLSLCIEEMAGNIVQHGFKPGEKRWLDLNIYDKPDSVIVRLRDNGAAFDPLAYSTNHQEAEHLGIRMIHKLADSFEYKRAMGLNNLIIGFKKEK